MTSTNQRKRDRVEQLQDQLRAQVTAGKQPDPKLEQELYQLMRETGYGVEEIELPD